jgi:CelD/BcsL family acetyltransferase involved in cellulose biosynthesis
MHVTSITSLDELESLAADWRKIADRQPFLGPDWLITWWRHLGQRDPHGAKAPQLAVLAVHDEHGELIALAPWYVEQSLLHGRTLRFLGAGSVCSDYLTIACRAGYEPQAVSAIAEWLSGSHRRNSRVGWDLLLLDSVNLADPRIAQLLSELEMRGAITSARPAGNCWHIALPGSWEEYVAQLSKTNRKRARRLDRNYLQTGRAHLMRAITPADLREGYRILVDLHTKRWQARGEPGIFAEPGIDAFHREATERLLATGQLRLSWLELDGQPAAAEYCLSDDRTVYSYQSGFDPAVIVHEPGVMTLVATVQDIIAHGFTGLDFLRGDEPYKLDWRAVPQPIHDVRILPGNLHGHVRQSLWQVATGAKDLLRAGRDAVLHHQ